MKIIFRDDRKVGELQEEVVHLRRELEYSKFKFRYFEERLSEMTTLNSELRTHLRTLGQKV